MAAATINNEFEDLLGMTEQEEVKPEPRRKIIIDEVEGQESYEVVGVNGRVYQIQRGVEVEVPASVVEVLRNAVATRWVKVKREDGAEDLVPRPHSAVPWRLVG